MLVSLLGAMCSCAPAAQPFANAGGAETSAGAPDERLIKATIEAEASAQASAFAQRNPALMAPSATDAYYQQLVRTNQSLLADGVSALELLALEWGPIAIQGVTAEATTFETWKTDYGSGAVDQGRDRNRYTLVRDSTAWKIRSSLRPDSGLFQPAAEGTPSFRAPAAEAGGAKSHNWSGYAAQGHAFTAVAASWIVPRGTSRGGYAADSTWIGIGGLQSNDLIQLGTEQRILASGKPVYDAWIEMLPQPAQTVQLNVSGGDSISARIEQQADGSWRLSLSDGTTGRDYHSDQQYPSAESSAEWIEESPSGHRGGLIPLDDFRSVSVSGATAVEDGKRVNVRDAGAGSITMTDRAGQTLAQPSQLGEDGNSFSVTRVDAAEPAPAKS